MKLDPATVFLLTAAIAATMGALLVFTWLQSRASVALLWWGSAFVVTGVGIALIATRGQIPDFWSLGIGVALPMAHCGMIWTGARVFEGRPVRPYAMLTGAGLYLAASQFESFATTPSARVGLSALIVSTYIWLAAFELWRGRSEALVSRWPAIVILLFHGAVSFSRIPLMYTDPLGAAPWLFTSGWQFVPDVERLIYITAASFSMLAMSKERLELKQMTAAMVDPLTQIANRRAFVEGAARRIRRAARDGMPVAVLIADLDHFKWVNDRFGHPVGDRVLRMFADTAVNALRPEDMVGRIGGEEFAAILAGADVEGAVAAAERLRAAFAADAAEVGGLPVAGSVSIGVASTLAADCDLDVLMARADGALYLAKARGRNRVETAPAGEKPVVLTATSEARPAPLPYVDPRQVPLADSETVPVGAGGKPLTH
jgi:diguanylate cyclase (GGDEF)-like protein